MCAKLIVVIMGPGKKHFAQMCLDSVRGADKILYFCPNMTATMCNLDEKFQTKAKFYNNFWDEEDPKTNGKCRQRYLEHLKEHYPDDWALILDEDEIIEDLSKIKEFIQMANEGVYDVHMRHFIGNLGWEDATSPVHVVPRRLFKISEADKYPEHSHPVLEGNFIGPCMMSTIWHLGHLPVRYMDYILKRYKQHAKDSIIHNPQFLKQWKLSHLLGQYPAKQINPAELPKQICDRYEIDKDEFYFMNRGLETKHFIMAKQWKNYFENKNVLDCGCGRGPYLCAWNVMDVEAFGFDKSKFAVMNPINANTEMFVADILDYKSTNKFDLVTAIDILEHLKEDELDVALRNIHKMTNKSVLFSIPFLGDPNLDADATHNIKKSKDWWMIKLSEYFIIDETPKDWLFMNQIVIGRKK